MGTPRDCRENARARGSQPRFLELGTGVEIVDDDQCIQWGDGAVVAGIQIANVNRKRRVESRTFVIQMVDDGDHIQGADPLVCIDICREDGIGR